MPGYPRKIFLTGLLMTQQQIERLSYIIFFVSLFVVGYFHLATPFLTVMLSLFVLRFFRFTRFKFTAIVLFLILVGLIFWGFIHFMRGAVTAFPRIASTSIPIIIQEARRAGFDLPFTDLDTLKPLIVDAVTDQLKGVARFAQVATEEFVFLIIGLVIAISIFMNRKLDLDEGNYAIQDNIYSALCAAVSRRARTLYHSFATVMGAQIIISSVNTILTAILIFIVGLPYAELIVIVTFLCGMLPIIGNVISNTIIVSIAITVSPRLAIVGLVFLIGIHKLEYFLNSKIIGGRIRNPMWLTLIGLIVGERVSGIPGMILAPVILYFIKAEFSNVALAISEKTSELADI